MALNVLVVDDSIVMRSMIIKTLTLSGLPLAEVHEASNGREGLEVLGDSAIDLAVIDINMPEMSGEEMIEHVRRTPATTDLPIIVVSTESSQTRIEKLQKCGAGFVHKPFTPEMLRETIAQVVGVTRDDHNANDVVPESGPDF